MYKQPDVLANTFCSEAEVGQEKLLLTSYQRCLFTYELQLQTHMNENKEKLFCKLWVYPKKKKKSIANKISTIWIFHLTLEASVKSVGYGFAKTAEETCADYHTAPSSGHICLYKPNFYKKEWHLNFG